MTARTLATLLTRISLRHGRLAPGASLALLGIVALGVGLVLSIRLANRAALASFAGFTQAVAGQSDWIATAHAGRIPADSLRDLRRFLGNEPVAILPIVETTGVRPAPPGAPRGWGRPTLRLLGVDIVALQNLTAVYSSARRLLDNPEAAEAGPSGDGAARFWSALGGAPDLFVTAAFAERNALRVGDDLPLILQDAVVTFRIAGIVPRLDGQPEPPDNLAVADIAALQRLLGRGASVDRIEFLAEDGPDLERRREALRARLEAFAAGTWRIESPAQSRRSGETMTAAFRLNLTILSLIALLVGGLLIVEALDGAVVRRRQEIAILRSLGVPPRTIRLAWLVESGAVGLLGSAAGIVLGWIGAQAAVRLVGRTIDALYFTNATHAAALHPGETLLAVAAGVLVALGAGWGPAWAACRTPPAEMLPRGKAETGRSAATPWAAGLACLATAALVWNAPPLPLDGGGRLPLGAYAACLAALVGAALLASAILPLLGRAARRWSGADPALRLAASRFGRLSGRHRLAVAGLVAAVGMTAAMTVMIGSFDTTMRRWIATSLQADLFVASDGAQSAGSDNRIRPETWRAIADDPDVARAAVLQAGPIRIDNVDTFLAGGDFDFLLGRGVMTWVAAPAAAPQPDTVPAFASEAFTRRFARGGGWRGPAPLRPGDTVTVPTPGGPRTVVLAGVFADYGNERGSLVVPRDRYRDWFGTDEAATLTLLLREGADAVAVRDRLQAAHPGLRVHSQASLREQALAVFGQTFAITHALELIGLVVAVTGLALSMASVLLDRRAELGTLRALGMRRTEIARTAAWEGAGVALAGVTGGLLLSLALGWILVFGINRQSFGWTLQFDLPWVALAGLGAAVVATGFAVSWLVGRWSARLPADREE